MSQNYQYFGKYILLERLAAGGMAEVFLARSPSVGGMGKFVAIKRILPQFSENPEFIHMFKDEAKIAINLSHNNIVSIYEFGVEDKQFFLVMDYVEGRNLRQILTKMKKSKARFNLEQIIYVVKEIAAGMDHAHRCIDGATGKPLNITHRDISPQNIMTSFEGEVKIVDFGIAKAESQMDNTRGGTLKGKFGYMSPEQVEGQPIDLRTDIFSLGIVLWELLASDRLFIANNEINTLRKIRDCHIPSLRKINPNIHPELERIAMKALARDRNLRYQTAAALHRDLNRFLNRQFPDFSQHDFSVFVKTLYADEILNIRKRQIEYSKIPFAGNHAADDDKTLVTAQTATAADTKSISKIDPTVDDLTTTEVTEDYEDSSPSLSYRHSDSGIKIEDEDSNTRPDAETGSMTDSGLDHNLLQANIANKNTAHSMRIPKVESVTRRRSRSKQSDTSHPSQYYSDDNVQLRKRSPFNIVTIMFLTAFLTGGYFLTKGLFPEKFPTLLPGFGSTSSLSVSTPDKTPAATTPASNLTSTEAASNQQAKPQQQPEKVRYKAIVVNSQPGGAEVFINGQPMGTTTPSRVNVPANRPFELSLVKNGYLTYTREDLDINSLGRHSLNATLQKAENAYIDIDVRPATARPHIYLNDVHLKEHLPVVRYAVPANKQLKLSAVDRVTGQKTEETLNLKVNQRKRVVLRFKSTKSSNRTPTHRK